MKADLIITGGRVIDGSGGESMVADVVVQNSRITGVGDYKDCDAQQRLNAEGKCVAPGFIDAHTHDDRVLLSSPDMPFKISQGVTTVVTGNCGVSLAPLTNVDPPPPLNLLGDRSWYRFGTTEEYATELQENPPAINSLMLVGHSTLRIATMDRLDRPATTKETLKMERLVDQAMEQGASGFSTGLEYPPSICASEDEVIALAKRASEAGGIYTTHMRNENDNVHLSIDETVRVASEANIRTVISHHKTCGKNNFGRTRETLAQIESAKNSVDIHFDVYPYIASSTSLLPQYLEKADRILITWSDPFPECGGMELDQICKDWSMSVESAVERLTPAGAIYFQMDEEDLQRVMKYPGSMIGSDGLPSDRHPHPRLWGTFPRVLGHYSRDLGLFSLEEAVSKMTGVTADIFGLTNRGYIREGMFADIVVFDSDTVKDEANFSNPVQAATGIESVFVNGELIYDDSQWTGKRPGTLLSRWN